MNSRWRVLVSLIAVLVLLGGAAAPALAAGSTVESDSVLGGGNDTSDSGIFGDESSDTSGDTATEGGTSGGSDGNTSDNSDNTSDSSTSEPDHSDGGSRLVGDSGSNTSNRTDEDTESRDESDENQTAAGTTRILLDALTGGAEWHSGGGSTIDGVTGETTVAGDPVLEHSTAETAESSALVERIQVSLVLSSEENARTADVVLQTPSDSTQGSASTTIASSGFVALVDTSPLDTGIGDGSRGPMPADGVAVGAGAGALALVARIRQLGVTAGTSAVLSTATLSMVTAAPSDALDRLVRLFAPFRYSRYDDSDPLTHDTRRTVYETIQEEPGAYLSAVSDAADVPLSTARHHVRVLEREDLLVSAKVRGKRRFYPDDAEGIEISAAMADDPTAAVLDALGRLGSCSVAELAEELGRDSSTVTHHLQRLDEEGLVVRERDGRSVINRLAPSVRSALDPDHAGANTVAAPADD